jgi:hypothetical protein
MRVVSQGLFKKPYAGKEIRRCGYLDLTLKINMLHYMHKIL